MPYLTAPPTMAPLTLRPANARITDAQSPDSTKPPHIDEDTPMTISGGLSRPTTPPRSSPQTRNLTAKNRRKRYLELNPSYFTDPSLELADPLLYDRLIRRFQTASERETEGRLKGFSGQMATDLWRAEAKKDALAQPNPNSLFIYNRGPQGQIVEEDKDEVPMTREEGRAWWVDEMTQRFLRGEDGDFEYKNVDGKWEFDDPEEERDVQDRWFESMESDFDSEGEGREKVLMGETGVQDY